jgi:hypothetical protein
MERVKLHYQRAIEHYGKENVLGVFLYGSQNYHCDLDSSDVDTKCILIPDLYHLAIKPYDVKHLHIPRGEENEVCECMTIMHMVSNWKKQNPNFLEILFTDYCIVNPMYEDIWEDIKFYREEIARYDVNKGLKSIAGQALHTLKENPHNGKKQGNAFRLAYLLDRYQKGEDYLSCLVPPVGICDSVKQYKAGKSLMDTTQVAKLVEYFDEITKNKTDYPIHIELDRALDNLILKVIQERMIIE